MTSSFDGVPDELPSGEVRTAKSVAEAMGLPLVNLGENTDALPGWFRSWSEAILEAEDLRYHQGVGREGWAPELPERLGRWMTAFFEESAHLAVGDGAAAHTAVSAILDGLRADHLTISMKFPAELAEPPAKRWWTVGLPDGGRVGVRMSQVLAARSWGIGLATADDTQDRILATSVLDAVGVRAQSSFGSLRKIVAAFGGRIHELSQIQSTSGQQALERLILDILNEREPHAHHASLLEDFLEKTDLRVHVPDIGRKRGARVQVTQTINVVFLEEKLSRIRRVEEFVVVSPRTLAEYVRDELVATWAKSDAVEFWKSLPTADIGDVDELAVVLRNLLLDAMAAPVRHPLGPLCAVPEPVRRLIRTYVYSEARRSTGQLRNREARIGVEDGRGRPVGTQRPMDQEGRHRQSSAGEDRRGQRFELALPLLTIGARFDAVVTNVVDFGAFVDLGPVDALLHRTHMGLAEARAPRDVLRIGDRLAVVVNGVDKATGRVSVELVAGTALITTEESDPGRFEDGNAG